MTSSRKKKSPSRLPLAPKPKNTNSLPLPSQNQDKLLDILIIVLLLGLGIYQSILYFGHQVVPNSDFPAFPAVARQLLSFQLPDSFKRLPFLGLLQVGLAHLVGGQYPDLTAGWLLNAILHPLNLVLLYLVAKRLIPRSAFFFALILAVNPWTLNMLTQPLVETTLIFFSLLTFFFLFRSSRWCYLFASITSIVRYEGAALILTVFVLDLILRKTKNQRLRTLVFTLAASLPLALWLLGNHYSTQPGVDNYISHFTTEKHIGLDYFNLLWETTFMPLLQLPSWVKALFVTRPATQAEFLSLQDAANNLFIASKILVVIGFVTALPYCLYKRQWYMLALLLFLGCYVSVHSLRMVSRPRYCFPIAWITLLICFYGWQSLWNLITQRKKLPPQVLILLQILLVIILAIWSILLLQYLPHTTPYSQRSASIPYVIMGAVGLYLMASVLLSRTRYLMNNFALSLLICLMTISNHFILVRQVGNGSLDAEFKMLADWYVQNARPGEKIVTTLPHVVRIFAPKDAQNILPLWVISGTTSKDFVRDCYRKKITYIAWDSRIGSLPNYSYYKKWGMGRIDQLKNPNSTAHYQFLQQIKINSNRYINVFRLTEPPMPAK